jgi:hypothetical protein
VAPKPLIVLFDEVDVLEGDALISFLRQLRGGFAVRVPGIFPVSIALVGICIRTIRRAALDRQFPVQARHHAGFAG